MFRFRKVAIVALAVALAAGCSKDEQQQHEVAPAKTSPVEALDARAKKSVDPVNLDQVALLVAEAAGASGIPDEVLKGVKAKWEGYGVVLLKHVLNKKTDVGESLPFAAGAFERALNTTYGSGKYPKTKRGAAVTDLLKLIKDQDIEIRWHYWQNWDGKELPTVTFNPGNGATTNVGYRLTRNGTGHAIQEVTVDDDYAFAHPTWIIDTHRAVPASDVRSGKFIPNYGEKPSTKGARTSESIVPGPTDGTAAVNRVRIWYVRTGGQNFRDIFNGGDNDMYFVCADEVVKVNAEGKSTQLVTIDRWAGRTGTWRWIGAEWDNNWKVGEDEQAIGVVGLDLDDEGTKEFSGTVTLGANTSTPTGGGNASVSQGYKRTTNFVDMLMENRKMERRTFFATNNLDLNGHGLAEGDCVWRAGHSTGRKQIYYSLRLEAYNYAP